MTRKAELAVPCTGALRELIITPDERTSGKFHENPRSLARIPGSDARPDSKLDTVPMKNFLILQNPPINLKNFKSNTNSRIKNNNNLYIFSQIIFPKRRCL